MFLSRDFSVYDELAETSLNVISMMFGLKMVLFS